MKSIATDPIGCCSPATVAPTEAIENLRTGMTIEAACLLAGIGRTTYYRWLDEDEKWADECKSAVRFAEAVLLERVKQLAMDKMD